MTTFSTMKTRIGNNIQDTSSATSTKIGVKINNRALDIWKRARWTERFNMSYTFDAVVGTATYNLNGDFGQEISVHDITDGRKLTRMTIGEWWEEHGDDYASSSIGNGTPKRYLILDNTSTKVLQIQLDPPPDATNTYAVPYVRRYVPLLGTTGTCTTNTASKIIASASTFITDGVEAGMRVKNTTDNTYGYIVSVDSETQLTMDSDLCPDGNETFTINDEFILPDIDWIVELGATGDMLMLKRRGNEANYYHQQYETELRRRIGQFKSQNNQSYQFVPSERFANKKPYGPNFGNTPYSWV